MDIIVLNAPPLSGKDKISEHLTDGNPNIFHEEVKGLLFEVAIRAAGVTKDLWDAMYTREYKEKPSPYLMINGVQVSPRQWMIHCSEHMIKPIFGNDAFGKAAVNRLKTHYATDNVIVFSDGGFPEELAELSNYAYATGGEFFLARVHREGCSWGNDSRNWLYLDGLKGHERDFTNPEGGLIGCAESILYWARGISYGESDE